MREIKFRAWCGNEVSSPFMQYSEQAERLDWFFTDIGDCQKLMQYTGLKDKNGMGLTEVYEDDIISEDGILKGNIYENDKSETDIVIPQLGTKAWETAYKEIVARGYGYSE